MGTIVTRKTAAGEVRYRAQIQIRREGLIATESRTFSKKSLAVEWMKRREAEIERDPSILTAATKKKHSMTLAEALARYLAEVDGFGRSKRASMEFLRAWPIAAKPLDQLSRQDYSEHTMLRRAGWPAIGAAAVAPSTALQDLQYIKTVLNHADLLWGEAVNLFELEQAAKGLRHARLIARSKTRDRLPTGEELQRLTNYFYAAWRRGSTVYPMHLVLWFAIYSCRRQNEITGLFLADFDAPARLWLVRDVKNPNGSEGNHKQAAISEQCYTVILAALEPDTRRQMRPADDRLFSLEGRAVSKYFTEACKVLMIDDLHFHDLRHEGATRLAELGLSIPAIQRHTLHDTWGSLERYASKKPRSGGLLDFGAAMAGAIDSVAPPASRGDLPSIARLNRPRGRPRKP